jgi:hypothetical protein
MNMREFKHSATAGVVADVTNGGITITQAGTSALQGFVSLFNLQTAAPVACFSHHLNASVQQRSGIFKDVTAQDEILIHPSSGGSMNAGTIYVQTYKRTATVISNNFTSNPLADWDIPVSKSSGSLVVLSSFDLEISTSASVISRVSTDGGSTFDSTINDYRRMYVSELADGLAEQDKASVQLEPDTATGLCATIYGMPSVARTIWRWNDAAVTATGCRTGMNWQALSQAEDVLRVSASTGTLDGGIGYAVKYKF